MIHEWMAQKPCISRDDCDPDTCSQKPCQEYLDWELKMPPMDRIIERPATALDCPVNCPYALMERGAHLCGCELGYVVPMPIAERFGGEARNEIPEHLTC